MADATVIDVLMAGKAFKATVTSASGASQIAVASANVLTTRTTPSSRKEFETY